MLVAKLDLVHKLPDGRRLSYCEYGDADGLAIVGLHGTLGLRYKFGLADREARRLGLRRLSPDRLGYGLSDAPPGAPGFGEYASDIAVLAWVLNLSRFGVVGISGGGPYAVALASQMLERVDALTLVAPVAPVSKAEERDGVTLFHWFAFRGLPRVPGAVSWRSSIFGVFWRFRQLWQRETWRRVRGGRTGFCWRILQFAMILRERFGPGSALV